MPFSIVDDASPDSVAFQTSALTGPSGFGEYDARRWFGQPGTDRTPELDLVGVQALGMGLGVAPDGTPWGLGEAVDALLRQNPEVARKADPGE